MFRRSGAYYSEDTVTRKQHSLRTKDESEAMTLLSAKNETTMNHRHGMQSSPVQYLKARGEFKELFRVLVVDVEFEKIVRQVPVMDGMLRVEPFTVQDELTAQHPFEHRRFIEVHCLNRSYWGCIPSVISCPRHCSTMRPSDVKWMPTFVPSIFSNQRRVGDKRLGFILA
jgi:hypothetical protein